MSPSGRITLPEEIRDELGLRAGDEIAFEETDDGYVVRKVLDEDRFERWRGVVETDETVADRMRRLRGFRPIPSE